MRDVHKKKIKKYLSITRITRIDIKQEIEKRVISEEMHEYNIFYENVCIYSMRSCSDLLLRSLVNVNGSSGIHCCTNGQTFPGH